MQHGTMTVMAKGTHPQLRRHVPKVHRKLAEKKWLSEIRRELIVLTRKFRKSS